MFVSFFLEEWGSITKFGVISYERKYSKMAKMDQVKLVKDSF